MTYHCSLFSHFYLIFQILSESAPLQPEVEVTDTEYFLLRASEGNSVPPYRLFLDNYTLDKPSGRTARLLPSYNNPSHPPLSHACTHLPCFQKLQHTQPCSHQSSFRILQLTFDPSRYAVMNRNISGHRLNGRQKYHLSLILNYPRDTIKKIENPLGKYGRHGALSGFADGLFR